MVSYSLEKYYCKEIFEDDELTVLDALGNSSFSLYKLQKTTNIPLTTLWRIVNRLIKDEYVIHGKRGVYMITLKGAFVLYLSEKSCFINTALKFFSYLIPNNTKNIIDSILNLLRKDKICILNIIDYNSLDNIIPYILYHQLKGETLPSCLINFLVENYLDKLPYSEIDGCKLFIIFSHGKKKIVIGKCKVLGNVNNGYCNHINKIDNNEKNMFSKLILYK